MANSQVYWSFGDLAFRWSREPGVRYSEDDVYRLTVPAFWRGEFDDSDLRFDEDKARLELYEPMETGSDRLNIVTRPYWGKPGSLDFPPLANGRVRQEVHDTLCAIGDETAATFDNPTDGSAFDALAKTSWETFIKRPRSKIVLKHIEVREPAFLRWCEGNGLGAPAFTVASEVGEAKRRNDGEVSKYSEGDGREAPRTQEPIGQEIDPYHTGSPGKPTAMHIVEAEFRRRADQGNLEAGITAQAEVLRLWLSETHPDAPTLTAKTIKNRLAESFRTHTPDIK